MAIDKKLKYDVQGGIRNYLGKQKTISNVPLKWKSGPGHPKTELAYITKEEKDLLIKKDLHNSLKNGPNKGPGGIMSLNNDGIGDTGGIGGGVESDGKGGHTGTGRSDVESPPGVDPSAPTDGTKGTLSDPREKFDYKTTTIGPKDKTGFFDSGLGKFVKNLAIGTILGPAVLGGTKIGGLLSTANTLNNVAGMFGKDIDVKSALGNVGTLGDTFAGFSTTGTKGPKDPTDDRGNGDGGNEKNALLSEYISLLQRMEQGMLSAEEQGRFNSLKSRLGKAQGGIMNVNMNKGKLGVMNG